MLFFAGIIHPYDIDNDISVTLGPLEFKRPLAVGLAVNDLCRFGNLDLCQ